VFNVNADPRFRATETTDYAILSTSGCLDGGTPSVQSGFEYTANWDGTGNPVNLDAITSDIDGNVHTDFNGDGTAQPNMGCYELMVNPAGTIVFIQ
jgi:hypothetical protein